MNFSQLHERLRVELLRRIDREVLTAALLARQTGLRQSHISNFLRSKRRLSLSALDRVLAAQKLSVEDLVPPPLALADAPLSMRQAIPLVSQASAINDQLLSPGDTEFIDFPGFDLSALTPRRAAKKRLWRRFVAVRLTPGQAEAMEPVLVPQMILVLDRFYNSLAPSESGAMDIFAVRTEKVLTFRYVSYEANRLILRPHRLESPIRLLEVEPQNSPSDLIVGRVCAFIGQR